MINRRLCALWILVIATLPLGLSGAISADDILRKADDRRTPTGQFSFNVRVEDYENSKKLRETTYRVYTKEGKKARVETTEPARLAGRKLLMRDNDLWMFLPDVKRPTRVSLQQRLTGEVSNGDIARTQFHEDYAPKVVGEEKLNNKSCYKLELVARHKDTTYQKIQLWVQVRSFRPIQADFFALSGKRLKRSTYRDFKPTLGAVRASEVEIRDALQPKRYSKLIYSGFKREAFDDSFFNKESLPWNRRSSAYSF